MLEEAVNQFGQKQIINIAEHIVKIEGKFLQIRLIRTKRYSKEGFTEAMPRAKFIHPVDEFGYVVSRKDLLELKRKAEIQNGAKK